MELDAAQGRVEFTLGDVLHTVHGTFHFKRWNMVFDPVTGAASGELVVDATSGDSGNKARDRKMHKEILESEKYPEFIFVPQHIRGNLAPEGSSQIQVDGLMTMHGASHPLTLNVHVTITGGVAIADASFAVPYVSWGLKNPSTFILRVNDKVDMAVHVGGRLTAVEKAVSAEENGSSEKTGTVAQRKPHP
jgi:polyisoprenoid-binding protein YceI